MRVASAFSMKYINFHDVAVADLNIGDCTLFALTQIKTKSSSLIYYVTLF